MSLRILQQLSGVAPDGVFGKNTFKAGAVYLGITNHACAVHFFAQTAHESGMFKRFTENLNYSAVGLRRTFGKYFPTDELAEEYSRQPERIANRVYANRMGNGSFESGDGWKFRGRGAIQLTGKDNYQAFAKSINDPKVLTDTSVVAGKYSFTSAHFYFEEHHLWRTCKLGLSEEIVKAITRRINGGLHGIEDRIRLTNKYSVYQL